MQHHGAALRRLDSDEEFAEALAVDWRRAEPGPRLAALLEYAEALTREPGALDRSRIAALRDAGLDDEAILHACEIVAYFAFVNRLADGLGVTLEDGWPHPRIGAEG